MAERDIHTGIKRYLVSQGAYVVKTAPPMDNGTPDLLACLGGIFVGIEVKKPGKSPSKIQQHRLATIRAAGGIAFVATSVEDVRTELEALMTKLHRARADREAQTDGDN